jgi:hypothetical protein
MHGFVRSLPESLRDRFCFYWYWMSMNNNVCINVCCLVFNIHTLLGLVNVIDDLWALCKNVQLLLLFYRWVALWPTVKMLAIAIAEAKQCSQTSVIGLVAKIYYLKLPKHPSCFGRPTKIYYLVLLRATEGILSRYSWWDKGRRKNWWWFNRRSCFFFILQNICLTYFLRRDSRSDTDNSLRSQVLPNWFSQQKYCRRNILTIVTVVASVNPIDSLVAFYDIPGRKGEVLFVSFVPN